MTVTEILSHLYRIADAIAVLGVDRADSSYESGYPCTIVISNSHYDTLETCSYLHDLTRFADDHPYWDPSLPRHFLMPYNAVCELCVTCLRELDAANQYAAERIQRAADRLAEGAATHG